MSLRGIGFENYRTFKNKMFLNLAPITVITGTNGSGKSSLFKMIRVLKSGIEKSGNIEKIDFGENHLGTPSGHYSYGSKDKYFVVTLPFLMKGMGGEPNIELKYSQENENSESAVLTEFEIYLLIKSKRVVLFSSKYASLKDLNEIFVKTNKDPLPDNTILSNGLLKSYVNHEYLLKRFEKAAKKQSSVKRVADGNFLGVDNIEDMFIQPGDDEFAELQEEQLKHKTPFHKLSAPLPIHRNIKIEPEMTVTYSPIDEVKNFSVFGSIWKEYDLSEFDKNKRVLDLNLLQNELGQIQSFMIDDAMKPFSCDLLSLFTKRLLKLKERIPINVREKLELELEQNLEPASFSKIGEQYFNKIISEPFNEAIKELTESLKNTEILGPLRGANLSEKGGSNYLEFGEIIRRYYQLSFKNDDSENIYINYWLKKLKIGNGFRIVRLRDNEYDFEILKDKNHYSIEEEGYGVRQLIPILLQIAINARQKRSYYEEDGIMGGTVGFWNKSAILVEEPESNLHPSHQSLLADIFLDAATKFSTQLVLETHSEYLVRKLQYYFAAKYIKEGDVRVYYFSKKEKYELKINSDGSLSKEFGTGFFDEATNLQFDLLELKKNQLN